MDYQQINTWCSKCHQKKLIYVNRNNVCEDCINLESSNGNQRLNQNASNPSFNINSHQTRHNDSNMLRPGGAYQNSYEFSQNFGRHNFYNPNQEFYGRRPAHVSEISPLSVFNPSRSVFHDSRTRETGFNSQIPQEERKNYGNQGNNSRSRRNSVNQISRNHNTRNTNQVRNNRPVQRNQRNSRNNPFISSVVVQDPFESEFFDNDFDEFFFNPFEYQRSQTYALSPQRHPVTQFFQVFNNFFDDFHPNRRSRQRSQNLFQLFLDDFSNIPSFDFTPVEAFFRNRNNADLDVDEILTHLADMHPQGQRPANIRNMRNLPDVKITNTIKKDNSTCTVCQEDFKIGETVKKLNCDHYFHNDCIMPWLRVQNTCPMCRKTI